jgi:hypothetical protein
MPAALIRLAPYLAALLLGAVGAWYIRGGIADGDIADIERRHNKAQSELQAQVEAVEAAGRKNRAESTARLDEVEKAATVDVQYVDREVIRYVTKYRDRMCPVDPERDFDWVCLYNRSLGLPCPVPEAGATGR